MGTFSDEKYSTYTKYAPKQLREQAPLRPDETQDQPTPSEFTAWVKGPSGRMKNWGLLHQMAAVMIFAAVVVLLVLIAKPLLQGANTPFAAASQESQSSDVRGVTDSEIRFGISAPFSGAAKELGRMKLGIETAFNVVNAGGGVHGRKLRLIAADDGYEPARTTETMKQLYEKDQVFGIIGNVGTPTAEVALPYALEQRMLFFGAFTGAGLLRRDPPDRYVFNYRASYAEETDAVVRYLVKMRRLRTDQIAVFAQQDAYGDAGFAGVARAIRALGGSDEA